MAGALTNFLWATAKNILAPAADVSPYSSSSSDSESSDESSEGCSTSSPGQSSTTSSSNGYAFAADPPPHAETKPLPPPVLNPKPNSVGYKNPAAEEKGREQKHRQGVGDQQQQQEKEEQEQGQQQDGEWKNPLRCSDPFHNDAVGVPLRLFSYRTR